LRSALAASATCVLADDSFVAGATSLPLARPPRLARCSEANYLAYAADFRGPGADLWRADNGGKIHAEGFEVVFLLKRGSTCLLAIGWKGAEGSALSLHAAEGPGPFKEPSVTRGIDRQSSH
jgi:hypothetical protein